jgi:anthranilate/para-aminobenzoate synthase component II
MHGKTSEICHDGRTVFQDVPQDFTATRYHSLVVDRDSVPGDLEVSAETAGSVVMGLRHRSAPIEGIQFHPESVLTVEGPRIIQNWVESLVSEAHQTVEA